MNFHKKNKIENKIPAKFFYIWDYLEWGGAQILFLGIMKEAAKHGEVLAIMPEGSNSQLLRFLDNVNVPYKFFPANTDIKPAPSIKRKLERHKNKFNAERSLLKYLKQFDFTDSIIHTELAPWQSLTAILFLMRKTHVFVTMHNSLTEVNKLRYLSWKLKFKILTKSKRFHLFTANNDTRESVKPFVSKKFFESIKVIYANINPDEIDEALGVEFDREKLLSKHKIPQNKFLVFCVGQFIDRKGRWVFLEAAKKILEHNDDIAFVWISNSNTGTEDLKRVENYDLKDNFRFLTSEQIGTEHIDLFKMLRLADVFALPSFLEGLPISIIEAMALGIPTISTKINAIPEALKHLETGLLINPGNIDELKDAILQLKNDQQLRNKLSTNGRKFALENFNEKVVAKIAVETYIEAFNGR